VPTLFTYLLIPAVHANSGTQGRIGQHRSLGASKFDPQYGKKNQETLFSDKWRKDNFSANYRLGIAYKM